MPVTATPARLQGPSHAARPLSTSGFQHASEDRVSPTVEIDSRRSAEQERRSPLTSYQDHRRPDGPIDGTTRKLPGSSSWMEHPPSRWNNAQVAGFLESLRVPDGGLTLAVEHNIQGCELVAIIQCDEAHIILQEDLGIEQRITRIQIIADLNQLIKQTQGTMSVQDTEAGARQPLLTGERALRMPTIPIVRAGQDYCNPQEYKIFMQDAQDWANLQLQGYGRHTKAIYDDPVAVKVDTMVASLCETGQRMDMVLGVHLRAECSMSIKKHMTSPEHYQHHGVTSALRIMAFLGTRINKKCAGRFLTLSDRLSSREPVQYPQQLKAELSEIGSLVQDISHQGQPRYSNQYTVQYT